VRTFSPLTGAKRYHIYIENEKKLSAQIAKDIGRHRARRGREL
jgi:IS30 family transposase